MFYYPDLLHINLLSASLHKVAQKNNNIFKNLHFYYVIYYFFKNAKIIIFHKKQKYTNHFTITLFFYVTLQFSKNNIQKRK